MGEFPGSLCLPQLVTPFGVNPRPIAVPTIQYHTWKTRPEFEWHRFFGGLTLKQGEIKGRLLPPVHQHPLDLQITTATPAVRQDTRHTTRSSFLSHALSGRERLASTHPRVD